MKAPPEHVLSAPNAPVPVKRALLKHAPTNNGIVLQWYYYRDNNEVVELSALHQNIREYMFLRKSWVTRRMTCALVRFPIPC